MGIKEKKAIRKVNTTLWQRSSFDPGNPGHKDLSEPQAEFLYNMMDENLDHARHIENERITFNSIYIALAAGVMAFISTIPDYGMKMGMIVLLFIMGIIAMLLTYRWNNAFDRHTYYAKKCYAMLHRSIFPLEEGEKYTDEAPSKKNKEGALLADEDEMIAELKEIPIYCFHPKDPVTEKSSTFRKWAHGHLKTKKLFYMFYVLLEVTLIIAAIIFTVEALG